MNNENDQPSQQANDQQVAIETVTISQPEEAKPEKDDKVVRVTRTSSIRAQIGYTMKRVKSGDRMTITGIGLGMSKAITIASIVRDRIGNVHMLNSFQEVEDKKRPEAKVTGITIVLTTQSDLDSSDNGYQKPQPIGHTYSRFHAQRNQKKKAEPTKERDSSKSEAEAKKIQDSQKTERQEPAKSQTASTRRRRRRTSDAAKQEDVKKEAPPASANAKKADSKEPQKSSKSKTKESSQEKPAAQKPSEAEAQQKAKPRKQRRNKRRNSNQSDQKQREEGTQSRSPKQKEASVAKVEADKKPQRRQQRKSPVRQEEVRVQPKIEPVQERREEHRVGSGMRGNRRPFRGRRPQFDSDHLDFNNGSGRRYHPLYMGGHEFEGQYFQPQYSRGRQIGSRGGLPRNDHQDFFSPNSEDRHRPFGARPHYDGFYDNVQTRGRGRFPPRRDML